MRTTQKRGGNNVAMLLSVIQKISRYALASGS